MGRTVMSKWETVQLEGLDLFVYLMERFGNTPEQALETMKEHGQDIEEAKKFAYLYHLREEALKEDKQKGNKNETND